MEKDKTQKLVVELTQADLDRIEAIMAETTGKFIEELPRTIQTRLEQAVAKMIGFEKDTWNHEWKVDHCNGRMSVISDLIGKKAKQAAVAAADQLNFVVTPEIQKAMNEEYARCFNDALRDQLRQHVHRTVSNMLEKAAASNTIEVELVNELPTKKEIANPAYGKKAMEELILKIVAERGQAGD